MIRSDRKGFLLVEIGAVADVDALVLVRYRDVVEALFDFEHMRFGVGEEPVHSLVKVQPEGRAAELVVVAASALQLLVEIIAAGRQTVAISSEGLDHHDSAADMLPVTPVKLNAAAHRVQKIGRAGAAVEVEVALEALKLASVRVRLVTVLSADMDGVLLAGDELRQPPGFLVIFASARDT